MSGQAVIGIIVSLPWERERRLEEKVGLTWAISGLGTFGTKSGITRSSRTVSFVTNHDTQHDRDNNLMYKDPNYLLATEWLLADGYGSPQVFSSFTFKDDTNQGPPSNDDGIIDRASCGNGKWTCDHVKPGVVAMVKFHQYVGSAKKRHVYGSEFNVLAFSRGTKGWAGFNNNTKDKAISVKTGLKKGIGINEREWIVIQDDKIVERHGEPTVIEDE